MPEPLDLDQVPARPAVVRPGQADLGDAALPDLTALIEHARAETGQRPTLVHMPLSVGQLATLTRTGALYTYVAPQPGDNPQLATVVGLYLRLPPGATITVAGPPGTEPALPPATGV